MKRKEKLLLTGARLPGLLHSAAAQGAMLVLNIGSGMESGNFLQEKNGFIACGDVILQGKLTGRVVLRAANLKFL